MNRFSHIFDGLTDDQLAGEEKRLKAKIAEIKKADEESARLPVLSAKLAEVKSRRAAKTPCVSDDLAEALADVKRLVTENKSLSSGNEKLLADLAAVTTERDLAIKERDELLASGKK